MSIKFITLLWFYRFEIENVAFYDLAFFKQQRLNKTPLNFPKTKTNYVWILSSNYLISREAVFGWSMIGSCLLEELELGLVLLVLCHGGSMKRGSIWVELILLMFVGCIEWASQSKLQVQLKQISFLFNLLWIMRVQTYIYLHIKIVFIICKIVI